MPNPSQPNARNVTFTGSSGDTLAARLDLPAGRPRAYALFAHCFTCSKDIFAAARIAGELTAHGIAVLRFDFTGLGHSEGEFANTNFSSNIEDLLSAVDYLRENFEAPQILVGHSLGGAAIIAAAPDIPEAKAVATIGAPADAQHVVHNFSASLDEIQEKGVAHVKLAGRDFTIKKQFIDDLKAHSVAERAGQLRKALLIFHAPLDATVGIENAADIYNAARHPKSFISLDDADHLLSRRADAVYVAQVLSAWASRYLDAAEEQDGILPYPGPEDVVSVAETGAGKFQAEIVARSHRLLADEPAAQGGMDSGPTPYDFLSMALGACTSMTLRMYADHKKLPLERVTVQVRHGKVHAEDCAECENREGRVDRFEREIDVAGELDGVARQKLLEIADKCPVHRTLESSSVIVTKLAEN